MTLAGLVASQVAWDWLFGEDLGGRGKEAWESTLCLQAGSLVESFRMHKLN